MKISFNAAVEVRNRRARLAGAAASVSSPHREEIVRSSLRSVLVVMLVLTACATANLPALIAQEPESGPWNAAEFGSSVRRSGGKKGPRIPLPKARIPESPDDVVRIDTRLVINDVLVLDKKGQAVRNLNRADFQVFEDGESQEITTFAPGKESGAFPRSIVLIIDYSGSQLPYISESIAAAKTLVDRLNPSDRLAIVTDDVEMLVDFTSDRSLLKEKLDLLNRKALTGEVGKSRQYSALMATLREMFREGERRPIIIFQTDGDELMRLGKRSFLNVADGEDWDNFKFDDVLEAAEHAGASINVVMPGLRFDGLSEGNRLENARIDLENSRQAYSLLKKEKTNLGTNGFSKRFIRAWAGARSRDQAALGVLAKTTGGWSANLERPQDADAAYQRIFSSIDLRYMIGYYPTNQNLDGKRREVTVKVRNCQDCIVWGRKTYIAPEGER
jgi:VWFA-related protein